MTQQAIPVNKQRTAGAALSKRFGVMKARIGAQIAIRAKGEKRPRIVTVEALYDLRQKYPKAKVEVLCQDRACHGASFDTWEDMQASHEDEGTLRQEQQAHVIVMRATHVVDSKTVEIGFFSDEPFEGA